MLKPLKHHAELVSSCCKTTVSTAKDFVNEIHFFSMLGVFARGKCFEKKKVNTIFDHAQANGIQKVTVFQTC